MSGALEGIYEPGVVDPGLPVANGTSSFWHSKGHPLSDHQSSWPSEPVDVVIIGSGISGMSIARTLAAEAPQLRAVLVEARALCSGATGRNGGHCKTMTFAMWEERKASFGIDEAIRITEWEDSHLGAMSAAILQDNIDCDLVLTDGIEAYYDEASFQRAMKALEDMRAHLPQIAGKHTVHTDKTFLRKTLKLSDKCVGAVAIPAASVWPYKWISSVMASLVEAGKINLQTNTPVHDIMDDDNKDYAIVKTSRGDIATRHVVHATNAWLGHLLPELRPYISPVRGNIVRFAPLNEKAEASVLGLDPNYSLWLRYGDKDYDYLIQRKAGDVVVGRANTGRKATADDSTTDISAMAHLRGFADEALASPRRGSSAYITHAWAGILAFSQDAVPFVGRLPFPGRKNQWVCGGYHATGMIKAFRASQLCARMVMGGQIDYEYPQSFLITKKRMHALRQSLDSGKMPVFYSSRM
ncbi:unnamed protein product [Clonostachys byssicola]|uniref:FAD dependent oxidoreductase domain-containing protein n=1 Tax=Clonostachys byssicola TaxID=160290 RepID=A0A9N9XWA8_9HYPO|nr:unnamed protein product [Clonostachys byssicola]